MPASSTTRPVSVGKASVCATAADAATTTTTSCQTTRPCRMARIAVCAMARSELHRRRPARFLRDREGLHRLLAAVERVGPDHAGKRPELGVVHAHRLDVVAPRHRDAVLGAFELRLKGEKILV